MKKNKVAFTGGGTGGHVYPGLAIIEELLLQDPNIETIWIGNRKSIEYTILKKYSKIRFLSIPAGKLRRYFSFRNFIDVFKIISGVFASVYLLVNEKPALLFSKGGFVSVPPVFAARILNIPVFTHESDYSPGLATKINSCFAEKIFVAYEETQDYLKQKNKVFVSGNPVRRAIRMADAERMVEFIRFSKTKPILLVLGGSLGAQQINELIVKHIKTLELHFNIIHQTGIGKKSLKNSSSYFVKEYFDEELPTLLAAADLVISRAGAGTIWENFITKTAAVLIPLSTGASRGDQILNSEYAEKHGLALVLSSEFTDEAFLKLILSFFEKDSDFSKIQKKLKTVLLPDAALNISTSIIERLNYES